MMTSVKISPSDSVADINDSIVSVPGERVMARAEHTAVHSLSHSERLYSSAFCLSSDLTVRSLLSSPDLNTSPANQSFRSINNFIRQSVKLKQPQTKKTRQWHPQVGLLFQWMKKLLQLIPIRIISQPQRKQPSKTISRWLQNVRENVVCAQLQ